DTAVAGPAGETGVAGVADAARHPTAVVGHEVAGVLAGRGAAADRVDAGLEAVPADRDLPLHGAGSASGEAGHARAVVLRATRGRRARRRREVAADVARVELDRVEPVVHVEEVARAACGAGVSSREGAAVAADEEDVGRAVDEGERVLVDVHGLPA